MSETLTLDDLVGMGKETLEGVYGVEGSGFFHPIMLAEYMSGQSEVTLLAGGLDNEALADALILIARGGPLRSLTLTTDTSLRDDPRDALIILNVDEDGQPRAAMAPYIIERTAHRASIVWDDTLYPSSDPRLSAALQICLSASRATMGA